MTSRLDRLFVLLDQGTTPAIRKAAATQLGEIQKLHPNEFDTLLVRLKKYLYSNSWDTRIAANQAIEAIIKNINWEISDRPANVSSEFHQHPTVIELNENRLCFENYSLQAVIENGQHLFTAKESPSDPSNKGNNETSRTVFKELGLVDPVQLALTSVADLPITKEIKQETPDEQLNGESGELKRKRSSVSSDDLNKRVKLEGSNDRPTDEPWPLLEFANELKNDLFNVKWEIRHGSAIALRDLIKFHGRNAGRISSRSCEEMDNLNRSWLIDLALRLVSVLALDKFGDFLSDQVVAPVRETCAQALGSIFNILDLDLIKRLLDNLIRLLERTEWEARHGGLLGLKYLLAVRQDLASQLLPVVFEPIFVCLKDEVDDVSAVAASSLVPTKDKLLEILPDKVPVIIEFLWDSLVNIDELTSSTSNILMLLSSLLAQQVDRDNNRLNELIPRLWPFLDHTLSIVRKSVLDAFIILISHDNSWLTVKLLSDSLRLLFQRILVEESPEIRDKLHSAWSHLITKSPPDNLLNATCLYLSSWICLLMQPARTPIDLQSSPAWLNIREDAKHSGSYESKRYYIGGTDLQSCSSAIKEESITNARLNASKFLSLLSLYLVKCQTPEPPSSLESICNFFEYHLSSKSAVQRMCVAWIIQDWARLSKEREQRHLELPNKVIEKCAGCLQEFLFFDEIGSSFTRVQHETKDFVNQLKANKLDLDSTNFKPSTVYTFQQITELLDAYPDLIRNCKVKLKPKIVESLDEKRRNLSRSLENLNRTQTTLSIITSASLSCALIACDYMPEKLNPIIKPLMESIKREENENLQLISAQHLTCLIEICHEKNTQPIPKIVKNLINFLCMDANFTPEIPNEPTDEAADSKADSKKACSSNTQPPHYHSTDIIALVNMRRLYETKQTTRRQNSSAAIAKLVPDEVLDSTLVEDTQAINRSNELIKRGACFALTEMFKHFKGDLPVKVPPLWQSITVIGELVNDDLQLESAQKLLQSLQLLEIVLPYISDTLKEKFIELLPHLGRCLECNYSQIRHLASRCLAVCANNDLLFRETMDLFLTQVVDLLDSPERPVRRQGAIEAFHYLIERLGIKIVPYIVLIVVPMLGRMSDQNESVRVLATQCFAQLVRLMPLDNSKASDHLIDAKFLEKKRQQSDFLEQLLNPKKLAEYKLPVPVNVELRSYQQEGINYLAFLNKYRLHGLLCDEQGLGKTLMSICMIAADHHYRSKANKAQLPSLVVCPSTLTGHWYFETLKFIDERHLKPIDYAKMRFFKDFKDNLKDGQSEYSLVIASYDIVRNDISFFSSVAWNYCILDEGHIIKNGKTKLSKAIKSISANHRLILTGTPIQNNVLELWSLFDFLMPGYLGTERQFSIRYSKPILASRDSKASSKEQEASVFAMESLHAQVLPFILRRLKDDVLKDLPPKIIQDYYCELSPLQSKLYEDFAKSNAKHTIEMSVEKTSDDRQSSGDQTNGDGSMKHHIFQALQYLRKVCNHPKLVLEPNHPDYANITKMLKEQNTNLSDVANAAKLSALKQLLLDCGIGLGDGGGSALDGPVVSQHRALIFFQMKSMLEIVQNDLLNKEMPSVTYLRLDGSVPANSRHDVVNRFNNDPSIDVLLLTTHVSLQCIALKATHVMNSNAKFSSVSLNPHTDRRSWIEFDRRRYGDLRRARLEPNERPPGNGPCASNRPTQSGERL